MLKFSIIGLLACLLMGCPGFGDRILGDSEMPEVTYESHVKALLANKCLNCHGTPPTNGAPENTDLTTYEYAVELSDRLYDRSVVRQDMPPQFPLTEEEANIIAVWIDAGTPRGESSADEIEMAGAPTAGVSVGGEPSMAGIAATGGTPSLAGAPSLGGTIDDAAVTWDNSVGPIVKRNCAFAGCHGGGSMQGSLNLDTYQGYKDGGANGELTGDNNADNSAFVDRLRQRKGLPLMPPNGALPEDQIELIEGWINSGSPEK